LSTVGVAQVYAAKGIRVFYSGLLSILIPQYVLAIGYSELYLGVVLVAILGGNVASNLLLTYFEDRASKRRFLQLFSLLAVAAGLSLAYSGSLAAILAGCFLGNISTTGTEAGPFQSIEAGVLPELAEGRAAEAFGRYNMIGYGASALGALAAGSPGFFHGGVDLFRWIFVGFAVGGAAMLAIYSTLRSARFSRPSERTGVEALSPEAIKDLRNLSALFSVDAFGGSFVSQYVLSSYFLIVYGVSSSALGGIFFVTSVIVAGSVYVAAKIAGRLGNLRTMVYTHLSSNVLLVAIPLAGSLDGALLFLFARQSLSQMDVPTRQALMAEMFRSEERTAAFALSNTARSVSTFAGGPVGTALLAEGSVSSLLLLGGFSKIIYDLAIFAAYRKRLR
jgi:predicted MFS family arabinose efflux permease